MSALSPLSLDEHWLLQDAAWHLQRLAMNGRGVLRPGALLWGQHVAAVVSLAERVLRGVERAPGMTLTADESGWALNVMADLCSSLKAELADTKARLHAERLLRETVPT